MKDTNNGMIADIFKRISMSTDPLCYETADQIYKAVLRAYFLGISDAKNDSLIKDNYAPIHNTGSDR